VNREQAARAIEVLAASPASRWIGNKIVDGTWLQKCVRCGAEQTLALPLNVHGPEDVPAGFDERLFDWERSFQVAHEGCTEVSPVADACPAEPCPVAPDVTMKRVLHCEKHGLRRWQGHVMCYACGRTFQTQARKKPGHAPEICRCGQRLMPLSAERARDILGPRTDGVIDGEGSQYQAQDWTARPICYLCHRYVAKHHNGRVPVEHGRN
jgi:hypothetical protein